jgi:hypothetical protein
MLTETQYPALFGAKSLPDANKPKKKAPRRTMPDLVERLKKAGKPKGNC